MKTYYVKVERTVYCDKNYEIEADSELEAGEIAVRHAEDEWDDTVEDIAPDWVLGTHVHDIVYAEESD